MSDNCRKLTLPTKLAFGIGSVGEVVFLGMLNSFIGIFYNQAIGLSNSLIGAAIMVALLSDAISDPIVGLVSDRWRSKLGRRHPFLFAAPVPLAVSLYFIFSPPEVLTANNAAGEANQWMLFAWLSVWAMVSRLCLTLYVIPHLALGGELTQDRNERSKLFSINAVCGYIAGALFSFVAWGYFLGGETLNADGASIPRHLDPVAYGSLVYTACGLVLTTIWLCAWGTKNQIQYLSEAPLNTGGTRRRLLVSDLLGPLRNRNYLFLMMGFFFFMISVGLNETFGVFVNTYFWELGTKDIRWFGLAAVPAILIGALAAPVLMRKFDRKPVLVTALIAMSIFAQLTINLRLLGLFPENDSPILLPLLVANIAGLTFATAIATVTVLSMLGDIADEIELSTGLRQEGIVYSARAFFAKASNSFGHLIAGIMLDVVVVIPFDAVPGQVDPDVIFRLGLSAGPFMGAGALFAIYFYLKYDLSAKRHAEILAEIKDKKTATAAI